MLIGRVQRWIAEQAGHLARDVREAARSLASSPAFVLVSTVSLGVGLGLATTVYSEYRSTIFRPVPAVSDPASLVTILQPLSHASLDRYAANGQFASLAAYEGPIPFVFHTPAGAERVWGQLVTPNYFDVLGVASGSRYREAADGVVVSERFWRQQLGADPAAVGKPLKLGARLVPVVGIAPRAFLGASPMMGAADLFVATTADARIVPELTRDRLADPRSRTFIALGRLRSGVSMEQAEAALDSVAERLDREMSGRQVQRGRRVMLAPGGTLFPIRKQDLPMVLSFPVVLIGLALWMACTNVATMALARAMVRERETAIRLALGATRGRIVARTLTETVMLSLLAAALGCAIARFALGSFDRLKPMMPGFIDVQFRMDWTSFAVAAGVAMFAGVLFGLVPALRAARTNIAARLASGRQHRVAGYRWLSVRNVLVLQQVAGSLTMLLLTGFIILGFQRSTAPEPGFDVRGLYTASFDPGRDGYAPAEAANLLERLETSIRAVAGVQGAARLRGSAMGPFGDMAQTKTGFVRDPEMLRATKVERVGPGYFDVMGIRVLLGRGFTTFESRHDTKVAIVNETLARDLGSAATVLGHPVDIDGARYSIVGVVKDVRGTSTLRMERGVAYVPLDVASERVVPAVSLVVRAAPGIDARSLIRERARALDPNLTVFDVRASADDLRQVFAMVRIVTFVYGGIGLFGLILAGIGLGGVTAYAVAQRRKEIGIRVALGAPAARVLRLVMREGAWLVLLGTIVGLAAAMGIGRAIGAYVELVSEALKTSFSDPVLLVGAPLALAVFTMLACWLPARRAVRIDPATTLREE